MTKRIDIWHNILWSRYKGGVFSALHKINDPTEFDIRFFQIAETEGNRSVLSAIDKSYHQYPYTLLFNGDFGRIGFWKRLWKIAIITAKSDAELSLLSGYERPETWVQMLIIRAKRKKFMLFCDSTLFDQPQGFIKGIVKKIIFRSADGMLGYGERAKEYALHYGVAPEKWHKRCQAAALPHDYTPETALSERLRLAVPPEAPRYLYVGRLSVEKNLCRLMEAFSVVLKTRPRASLAIIGNGSERSSLELYAKELGLNAKDIFLGSKSGKELFDEYAKATCFVLPSISEPWGLVVNEALHYGCPVIVSERCGCVPELVIEGKTGLSHKAFDSSDLADKMLDALNAFATKEKTAKNCLALMDKYTPNEAAKGIIGGIRNIV